MSFSLKLFQFFSFLGFLGAALGGYSSDLDHLIAPEVKNDAFYDAIYRLASQEKVSTILEIGSSSGEGSTDAFVKGIEVNPSKPTLFCIEVSSPRFAALKAHYQDHPQVICYQVSSVPIESFPSEKEVAYFYNTVRSALNCFGLPEVIRWLRQDIDYLKSCDVPKRGIELIKRENQISDFGMVLIDGSEFTGMAELNLVYGAKFIFLDDTRAFKNHYNYHRLKSDPNYQVVEEDPHLRHGYAIFQRVEKL